MVKIKIKSLVLTDFKGAKDVTYSFQDITKVMGQNGSGKSTIATAWYWLFMDKDYELKSNPNIRPNDAEECIPRVEAVLDINGVEISVAKQQKRAVSKPNERGISKVTLTNTYEINKVPKTERDFKSDLEGRGLVFDKFLPLSHPEVFVSQKASEMRKILFEMASTKSDLDIAEISEDTAAAAELLKSYKFEEIEAMHKASKKKAEEQVKAIPNQIVGLEKAKVDIDVAELELQKNGLQEQISEKEEMISDSNKAAEEYRKKTQGILDIKFKISDIEREATEKLEHERREAQKVSDDAGNKFQKAESQHKLAEMKINDISAMIKRKEEEKKALQDEWRSEKAKTFRDYDELPELDADALTCPTCGQTLPVDIKERKIADYEERKCKNREDYERDKEAFEKSKEMRISRIVQAGNAKVEEIKSEKAEIENLQKQIEQYKADKIEANKVKTETLGRLKALPDKPDLSGNQEYESLCMQVQKMEEALKSENSATDYRSALKAEISELQAELDEVNAKIGKASNNVTIDEQISELQQKQRDYEQAKADSERILYQLSLISKKKNEMLVEEINSNFSMVRWILFDYQKNGEYKECCIPTVDGRRFGDSTNTGREIIGKLDICNSLQKFFGMEVPVFLDNAESINDFNIPEMDCQLILMNVTEDKELRVEAA